MVTVTVSERDARAMFVSCAGGTCPHHACRATVEWLVADTPLLCEACNGWKVHIGVDGRADGEPWPTCPMCNGTGLPTVDIVTCGIEMTEYEAGKLTIGPALLIVGRDDPTCPTSDHLVSDGRLVWRCRTTDTGIRSLSDITGQFGDQVVVGFAHRIVKAVAA